MMITFLLMYTLISINSVCIFAFVVRHFVIGLFVFVYTVSVFVNDDNIFAHVYINFH